MEEESKSLESKYGWLNIIFSLCGGDVLKINKITKLELYTILTYMCYTQDKNAEDNNNYNQYK